MENVRTKGTLEKPMHPSWAPNYAYSQKKSTIVASSAASGASHRTVVASGRRIACLPTQTPAASGAAFLAHEVQSGIHCCNKAADLVVLDLLERLDNTAPSEELLVEQYKQFVTDHSLMPLCHVYMSDCTPHSTRSCQLHRFEDFSVVRRPLQTKEWLAELQFVFNSNGISKTVLSHPKLLQHKGTLAHLNALLSSMYFPRTLAII